MLSAFDIRTLSKKTLDLYDNFSEQNLIYLDSGGYESYHKKAPWDFTNYFESLNKIRFDILTAFDRIPQEHEGNIIPEMRDELLATNKVVKGSRKTLVLHATDSTKLEDLEEFIVTIKNDFDILGVPEKLCDTVSEGVETVKHLRAFMDKEQITKPIHIFGCGKLNDILKFVEAGADIFDANSWIYGIFNRTNVFSKNITEEELKRCSCNGCTPKSYWHKLVAKRYSHNFYVLQNGMDLIRQSIKDNELISLTKRVSA